MELINTYLCNTVKYVCEQSIKTSVQHSGHQMAARGPNTDKFYLAYRRWKKVKTDGKLHDIGRLSVLGSLFDFPPDSSYILKVFNIKRHNKTLRVNHFPKKNSSK